MNLVTCKKLMAGLLAASMAIGAAGCATTTDPYTGEEKTSNTTTGAGIGAVVGAFIGYASARDKDRRNRQRAVLAGAAIGGVGGAVVGDYMDRQEAELREKLRGTGVSVTRNGDDLILNMPGNVTFQTGKYDLKPDFREVLDSVVLVLNEFNQTLIESAGHTDSVGSEESNLVLSRNRANAVADYLVSEGISSERVLTVGHGELRPIADNATAEGRQLNRRVELTLIPITE